MKSKGVDSVKARVVNLKSIKDISKEEIIEAVSEEFNASFNVSNAV